MQAQGIPAIPAMTSEAERECYYRLTKEAVGKGEIIEFGAWLGASTAYMAAAVRDAGGGKVHTYDKFQTKKSHLRKVREFYSDLSKVPVDDAQAHFRQNLGPLLDYVEVHSGQIEQKKWGTGPIALIVNDAPKRIPAISAVLTRFRGGIREGTVMAWQDFCHFPSYEIPACLYRLREHFEFTEAVVPGSTMVFKVKSVWDESEVSPHALALKSWSFAEVEAAYEYWRAFVPEEKWPLFVCGKAMFLCDIGKSQEGVASLKGADDPIVLKKWAYLRKTRPDFFLRYRPLFDCVAA